MHVYGGVALKRIAIIILTSVVSVAVIGIFHYYEILMYEWTRPLIIVPIVYTGIHYRRAGSISLAILLFISQAPFMFELYAESIDYGMNYFVANLSSCVIGVYLGHVLRREIDNSALLTRIQSTLETVQKSQDDDALYLALEEIFKEYALTDKVETWLLQNQGQLVRHGDSTGTGLPDDHLFYAVIKSGEPFFSGFTPVDARIERYSEATDDEQVSQVAVFPITCGGKTRGVIALADSADELFGRETIAFLTAAKQSVENHLELLESRRNTIRHELQRDRIRDTFSSYVSRQVAEEILRDPGRLDLGGRDTRVAVMFTQISNFRELMKTLEADKLLGMLNQYLCMAVDTVFECNGTLDKFIEDSVMAFWGAPLPVPESDSAAVACALKLQRRMKELNAEWAARGLPCLTLSIGINSGRVVAGNIGSIRRMEYTVIGDTVNTAARLKSLSTERNAPLLISESTFIKVKQDIKAFECFDAMVKGKIEPITVYAVAVDENK